MNKQRLATFFKVFLVVDLFIAGLIGGGWLYLNNEIRKASKPTGSLTYTHTTRTVDTPKELIPVAGYTVDCAERPEICVRAARIQLAFNEDEVLCTLLDGSESYRIEGDFMKYPVDLNGDNVNLCYDGIVTLFEQLDDISKGGEGNFVKEPADEPNSDSVG